MCFDWEPRALKMQVWQLAFLKTLKTKKVIAVWAFTAKRDAEIQDGLNDLQIYCLE